MSPSPTLPISVEDLSDSGTAGLSLSTLSTGQHSRPLVFRMATVFLLACAAWLLCDGYALKHDRNYNRGLGAVLFAGIVTMAAGHTPSGLPESDTGHQIIALSRIFWPGTLWGMVLFGLLSTVEEKATCLWLIASPLFLNLLGLPVLANQYVLRRYPSIKWRIAMGLISLGIFLGHFLSNSSLGRMVNEHVYDLLAPIATFPTTMVLAGAAIMIVSVASMVRSHSQTANDSKAAETIRAESATPFEFPPLWGIQGPLCVITWVFGLALCVTSFDDSRTRATLVATNVAIVLMMAFLPPFSGQILGRRYDDYMRVLFIAHICTAQSFCQYYIWMAR